jgi:hemerythrin-like domain-containing protein
MSKVVRALRREHADMARLLDALERQLDVFDQGGTPDYDIVQGVIDYCLDYPDLYHHPKEDLVLERLRARDPKAAKAVGDLLPEHEALAALTRRFAETMDNIVHEAEVSREAVHDLAREFLDVYRKHIAMEEGRFFPAALAALAEADWQAIEAQLGARPDPVFGSQPDHRFERLRQDILAWEKADEAAAGGAQAT